MAMVPAGADKHTHSYLHTYVHTLARRRSCISITMTHKIPKISRTRHNTSQNQNPDCDPLGDTIIISIYFLATLSYNVPLGDEIQ
jgi:hypothetical protein